MYILGINAFHGDSSACIIKDGELIVATEEERFRRIKHWAGFPVQAIRFCLQEAGIGLNEVDYITISRDPRAHLFSKIKRVIMNPFLWKSALNRYKNRSRIAGLQEMLCEVFHVDKFAFRPQIYFIEHHRSHLASAFFVSPFSEAAILSIDGFGDFSSLMSAYGKGNQIQVLQSVQFPHSIGVFYTAMTQYLGFPHYGDEYKVMGLAPYGKPRYMKEMESIIQKTSEGLFRLNLRYFVHHISGVSMTWEGGAPHIEPLYSDALTESLGPARKKEEPLTQHHKDIAASVQKATEEIIFHILKHLYEKTHSDNLCVAGGVAQNSVANGKIRKNTPFKRVYIPPAGHDAGTAMGAAYYLYNQILRHDRIAPLMHAYTGASYSKEEIEEILKTNQLSYSYKEDDTLLPWLASQLAEGKVVGWFQGRAEFGPRALGHRSILADPRRPDAKDLLNLKIKRRESFRPFAPSILADYVDEYFADADEVPFMEKVYPIRKEKQAIIPAVTHVDGTGRLQTVPRGNRYYRLIDEFRKITGVPVLLNTSFNENEPIVNSPQEAIDCFLRTQMDILVLENYVLERA